MSFISAEIRYYSTITPQNVEWLWYPYIPYGRITVIQGDPGEGKTTFALHIAAMLSTGTTLPVYETAICPQNVIYQSTEDGLADTIKPRLIAAGADCDRIAYIDAPACSLTLDDERIKCAIQETNARLLVLDPMQAFIGADADMHRANDMRPILQKLSALAELTHCAIVIIGHMNKATGAKGLYRGLGSIDIAAAARSVLLIGRLKDEPTIRVMTHLKSNLAPEGKSVAFEMEAAGGLRWVGYYDVSADDLLSGAGQPPDSKLLQARTLLRQILLEKPMLCTEIYALCRKHDIGERSVDSAKRLERIQSIKRPDGWYWTFTGSENI